MLVADDQVRTRLVEAVKGGSPLIHAAAYAGLSERTLFRTLERGESAAQQRAEEGKALTADDALCADLWEEIRAARVQVAIRNVALVQKAATGGYVRREKKRRFKDDSGRWVTETETEYADLEWRAAKWLLETSFSKEFGPHATRLEVTGADGGPVGLEGVAGDRIGGLAARVRQMLEQREADEAEDREAEASRPGADVVDGEVVEDPDEDPDEDLGDGVGEPRALPGGESGGFPEGWDEHGPIE